MSEEEVKQPTKAEIETVEQSLVQFVTDLQRTLKQAQDIVNKLGFSHLGVTLQSSISDIDIYLKEYKKQKDKPKEK
jgi:3-dehydroquinate dehydratase